MLIFIGLPCLYSTTPFREDPGEISSRSTHEYKNYILELWGYQRLKIVDDISDVKTDLP